MKTQTVSSKRNTALDIIRCFALFFVVSVHFFKNTGYYDEPMQGISMFFMTLIRSVSMICVPLFLLLTGYLNKSQQLDWKSLKKLGTILLTYLLASVFCYGYRVLYLEAPFSVFLFLQELFSYNAAPYSWYVAMYIGLSLLAPFFNTLFCNLDKKGRQLLVLVLVFLSFGASLFNLYLPITPDYWLSLFPFAYYFIGAYIREYPLPRFSPKTTALQLLFASVITGYYNFRRSHNAIFAKGLVNGNNAIAHLLIAVLFFCLILQFDYSKVRPTFCRILEKISKLSFGAYLVSWVFDSVFYEILNSQVATVPERFRFYPLIVPAVYAASLLTSWMISIIQEKLQLLFTDIGKLTKKFTLR